MKSLSAFLALTGVRSTVAGSWFGQRFFGALADTGAKASLPTSFGVVLFPNFQALDVFGPLDALNTLSWHHHDNKLHVIADTLDPVSTGNRTGPPSLFAERVVPTHTFATAPPLDVILVPGGLGAGHLGAPDNQHLVAFLRERYPSLHSLITVCTGAGLAAQAGVLDGRHATTNKKAWFGITPLGSKTFWRARARWVRDGNVWTSSGVSAGIDVMFAWMKEVYGEEEAKMIAEGLEYVRHEDPNDDPFTDVNGAKDVQPAHSEL